MQSMKSVMCNRYATTTFPASSDANPLLAATSEHLNIDFSDEEVISDSWKSSICSLVNYLVDETKAEAPNKSVRVPTPSDSKLNECILQLINENQSLREQVSKQQQMTTQVQRELVKEKIARGQLLKSRKRTNSIKGANTKQDQVDFEKDAETQNLLPLALFDSPPKRTVKKEPIMSGRFNQLRRRPEEIELNPCCDSCTLGSATNENMIPIAAAFQCFPCRHYYCIWCCEGLDRTNIFLVKCSVCNMEIMSIVPLQKKAASLTNNNTKTYFVGKEAQDPSNGIGHPGQPALISAKWKTEMCVYFLQGKCNKTKTTCSFAHGEDDLQVSSEMLPRPETSSSLPRLHNYKTNICYYYLKGCCNYTSEECRFAHGESDLRTVEQNCRSIFGEFGPDLNTENKVPVPFVPQLSYYPPIEQ